MKKAKVILSRLVFVIIISSFMCPSSLVAQSKNYTHNLFSFKIHDKFEYKEIEGSNGVMAYVSSTTIMEIVEEKRQPNAAKYADLLEGKLLEKFDTENAFDTLDGWPVIVLIAKKKSDLGTWERRYFFFDDGSSTFVLSISGWGQDQRIIDDMFAVTKNSFKFTSIRRLLTDFYFDVPKHMGFDRSAKMIWSRCYDFKKRAFDNAIRFNVYPDEKFASAVKEKQKMLKKDKATNIVDQTMTINGFNVAKLGGTRTQKLEKGYTKIERYIFYLIENPNGGVSYIWFTGDEAIGGAMEVGMDKLINSIDKQ